MRSQPSNDIPNLCKDIYIYFTSRIHAGSCAAPLPASLADLLLFLGLSSVLAALLSFPWSLQSKFSFMMHVSCSYSFFLLQPYMLQTKLVLSTCPHHFTSRAQLHPFWLPLLCPGTCAQQLWRSRENGRIAFTCLRVMFFPLPSPLRFSFGSFLAHLPFVFPLSNYLT